MSCLNPAAAASVPARLHVPERLAAGRPAVGLRRQGHHSDEQLRTLAYEVTLAEARERERIATGLHDDIGQVLAIVGLKLGELGEAAEPATRAELVGELRALVQQASRATRTATFELSCPVLHQLGLQAAIESLAPRAKAASNLDLVVCGSLPPLDLPEQVLAVVFRVVRELVANVGRHARAGIARVQLYATADRLSVAVADDGAGFDAARPRSGFGPEGGYGLFSAEAQIQAIGGRLDIESAPGRGTRATILLPLANGGIQE